MADHGENIESRLHSEQRRVRVEASIDSTASSLQDYVRALDPEFRSIAIYRFAAVVGGLAIKYLSRDQLEGHVLPKESETHGLVEHQRGLDHFSDVATKALQRSDISAF